jgi:hypothetical protein
MAYKRDPETLQNLTKEHLLVAAREWDSRGRVSNFKSKTPHEVVIGGRAYPTKAIVALAHELAGLGTLTSQQLAGEAARQRLHALGFRLATADDVAPARDPAADSLDRLQRHHVEAAAAELRENMAWAIAQKYIARKPHETEWRVGIDDLWYNPRALRVPAYAAAGMPIHHDISKIENQRYRTHLENLGFPVRRGRTPVRAPVRPRSASELRRAAAAIGRVADEATTSEAEDPADPLQILLDGAVYPAGILLGLKPGMAPNDQDVAAIMEAGAVLRAAPDPLDRELETLATSSDLSTEARREVTARIGQGRFRAALMRLNGGCSVTGVSTPEVLRAAHIHRWADCTDTPAARLDPDNGLLLTANLDALFEVGLIAFDDEGSILISARLDADAQAALGIHAGMRLTVTPSAARRAYLAKHRDRTGGWP